MGDKAAARKRGPQPGRLLLSALALCLLCAIAVLNQDKLLVAQGSNRAEEIIDEQLAFVLTESKWYDKNEVEVHFGSGDPRISFRDADDKEISLVNVSDFTTEQIHGLLVSHGIYPTHHDNRNLLKGRGVQGL